MATIKVPRIRPTTQHWTLAGSVRYDHPGHQVKLLEPIKRANGNLRFVKCECVEKGCLHAERGPFMVRVLDELTFETVRV